MKNILLIGGAGFIGSSLIERLTIESPEIRLFVVEPEGADVSQISNQNVTLCYAKLSDVSRITAFIEQYNIDTLIHLVSTLVPSSTYEDFLYEFRCIVSPSIELMEVCTSHDVKFIYFSSGGTIYGNRQNMVPFKETDPMLPISYYGWSKQMMENGILFVHRTQKLKYLILRPSNPYGQGQNMHGRQGLIAVAMGAALFGETLNIWGDGSAIRDYIYIDDLTSAVCQLLYKDVCNETINIGSGIGYSVNEVIDLIRNATGKKIEVKYKKPRSVDVSTVILDTAKLRENVDTHFRSLSDGIRVYFNGIKQYRDRPFDHI